MHNVIDKENRTVSYNGQIVKGLTNKEYDLLITFIWRPDRVVTIADLETALYGYDGPIESRSIVAHVSNLRGKLPDPKIIETVRGEGYKLVVARK